MKSLFHILLILWIIVWGVPGTISHPLNHEHVSHCTSKNVTIQVDLGVTRRSSFYTEVSTLRGLSCFARGSTTRELMDVNNTIGIRNIGMNLDLNLDEFPQNVNDSRADSSYNERGGSTVDIESYQYLKYRSILSFVDFYRKPTREYLNKLNANKKYNSNYISRNCVYLSYACISWLGYLAEAGSLDTTVLRLMSADRMTLGQLYALNTTAFRSFCNGCWGYKCFRNLPENYFPMVPSESINCLNDDDVVYKLLYKFNSVSHRLLPAQKARLTRKVMGVPLLKLVEICIKGQAIGNANYNALIPNGEILSLIPLNYFRHFNYAQLLPFIYFSPINSPQSKLFAHLLRLTDSPDKQIFSHFKVALSLPCYLISKVNVNDLIPLLTTFSTMPEPYSLNYETIRCLHKKYIEYISTSYNLKSCDEGVIMVTASEEDHIAAGGQVLAYFKAQSWNYLPGDRCMKMIEIVGKLSISRLLMVQPSHRLMDLTEIALKCLGLIGKQESFTEKSLKALGNLINYISPKYINRMSGNIFVKSIPYLSGFNADEKPPTAFIPPCHDDLFLHTLNKKIIDVFGNPGCWSKRDVAKISCLLSVLSTKQLSRINDTALLKNSDLVRACWGGFDNQLDFDNLRLFYQGTCRFSLGNFYYVRQLKVKNVLQRFQSAMFSAICSSRDSKNKPQSKAQIENDLFKVNDPCDNLCPVLQDLGSIEFWSDADIEQLGENEFSNCLDFMGARYVPEEVAIKVWQRLIQVCDLPEYLDKQMLMQLGSLVRGISDDDFTKINLNDADVLGEFGRVELWSTEDFPKLRHIAAQVKKQYKREIQSYTAWDFMILGQITCGFSIKDLKKISNLTFADGIAIFSQLQCPPDVTKVFANKVVNINVFGSPKRWGPGIVTAVGTILSGLTDDDLQSIPACAFNGLSSHAASIMPSCVYQKLTDEQLSSFPPEAIALIQLFGKHEPLKVETKTVFDLVQYNQRPNSDKILYECFNCNWNVFYGSIHGDDERCRCLDGRDSSVIGTIIHPFLLFYGFVFVVKIWLISGSLDL